MSLPSQSAARCCRRVTSSSFQCLRSPPAYLINRRTTRRWQSTESTSPKITTIVDQISQLTLLETADLVSTLKIRLNIADTPIFSSSGPAAAAAPAPIEEDEAPAAAPAKTLFNLTLKSFDAGAKPKIIKEIKGMLGLSLVDSKKFVEGAPKLMKEGVPKEEAEKVVETLKGLGGVVLME